MVELKECPIFTWGRQHFTNSSSYSTQYLEVLATQVLRTQTANRPNNNSWIAINLWITSSLINMCI